MHTLFDYQRFGYKTCRAIPRADPRTGAYIEAAFHVDDTPKLHRSPDSCVAAAKDVADNHDVVFNRKVMTALDVAANVCTPSYQKPAMYDQVALEDRVA